MHHLEFGRLHDYPSSDETVSIPVELRSGSNYVPVVASVDTGASFCIFGAEIAEALGLDLTSGIRKRFSTANSGFDAYGTRSKSPLSELSLIQRFIFSLTR